MVQNVIPALQISSWNDSRQFYIEGLRFAVDWQHRFESGFPLFIQISRGDLTLYLSEHTGDCEVGGLVYLYVEDVDAWHRQVVANGIDAPPPENQEFGLRDFRVRDCDGNQLNIATRF